MSQRAKQLRNTLAPVMDTARVARVMARLTDEKWDARRARRWLLSCDALMVIRKRGPGGHPVYGTTTARFRREMQEFSVELDILEAELDYEP